MISEDFTLFDAGNPESFSRDIRGRMSMGLDYFRVLSRDYPAALGAIDGMHVYPEYRNTVLVVTTHQGIPSTVTTWERRNGDWKAIRLTVNAPQAMIDEIAVRAASLATGTSR